LKDSTVNHISNLFLLPLQVARHYLSDKPGFDVTAKQWTQMYAQSEDGGSSGGGAQTEAPVDPALVPALQRLTDMGFDRSKALAALIKHKGDEQRAVEAILLG
jgi:hypothetical protein